jgi:probable rRNA maturation factor
LPALTEAVVEDIRRSIYLGPWRVDIVRRAGVQTPLSGSAIARQVQRGLRAARASEPASVAVVLTDDAELTDLNREHMGIDGPTDVLSFPMLEPETFQREGRPKQRRAEDRPSARARGRTHIGDIAISVERAAEQAAEGRGGQTGDVRWSTADELLLLITHGTLHLCGWDHAEPAEEAAMRALERRLLDHGEG